MQEKRINFVNEPDANKIVGALAKIFSQQFNVLVTATVTKKDTRKMAVNQ